jgi:hypothetical protein
MNTPTPRTDAAQFWDRSDYHDPSAFDWFVRAEHARTLERELHESRNAERLARVQLGNERARLDDLLSINATGAARLAHAAVQLAAEREKVRMLRSALENLRDEQNGAPLERSRGQWQMAMDEAGLALAVTEDTP